MKNENYIQLKGKKKRGNIRQNFNPHFSTQFLMIFTPNEEGILISNLWKSYDLIYSNYISIKLQKGEDYYDLI